MVTPLLLLATLSSVLNAAAAVSLLPNNVGVVSGSVQALPTIVYSDLDELTAAIVSSRAAMAESAAICSVLTAQLPGAVTIQNSSDYTAAQQQPWYVCCLSSFYPVSSMSSSLNPTYLSS